MQELSDIDASETFYLIDDLKPYTQYRFQVVAITGSNETGIIGDIEAVTSVARKYTCYVIIFKHACAYILILPI